MTAHKVVGHDAWVSERKKHLVKEKEFTRLRDQLSQERRDLPWELVGKEYIFEGDAGRQTLAEIFGDKNQLVMYHAMFNPDTAGPETTWTQDAACFVCSFWIDNFNGITSHLAHRDIRMIAVSRAPYPAIAAYRKRMGWTIPWYSSAGGDFNFDYHVSFSEEELKTGRAEYNFTNDRWGSGFSEAPGISVFIKEDGQIYHTYSTYARGLDMLNVAYHYMDLVPNGRDEAGTGISWLRRHDEYGD